MVLTIGVELRDQHIAIERLFSPFFLWASHAATCLTMLLGFRQHLVHMALALYSYVWLNVLNFHNEFES